MQWLRKVPNLLFISFIVPWASYFGLIWARAIQVRPDGWYAAYLPHWGDGAAHLSYMAAFAFREQFPMIHPLFVGHPFTYSFAADMVGGWITRLGLPLWLAYNWWGFVLSLCTLIGLWMIVKKVTNSNAQTWITTNLFLLSGGLGWKYLIIDKLQPTDIERVSYMPLLYTQRESTSIAWLNTIVGELIPQRAFLLAIPIAALVLITWHHQFILKKSTSLARLILSGVLFGCMPIIHPHTTMVLALVLICWGLPGIIKNIKQQWRDYLAIGIPALVIGGILTSQFLTPSVSTGFFRYYPGWLARSKEINWVIFWIDNWGIFLPLAAFATWKFLSRQMQWTIFPFWLWFILANLFLFQPYDWDNSKILTWVYLFLAIPVSVMILRLWANRGTSRVLAIILSLTLTLAGGLDAGSMLNTKKYALPLVNAEEVNLAQRLTQITPSDAVILTSTTHRNWAAILTGRQILCGYLGWMWTYGIKTADRVDDIRNIYAGTTSTQALIDRYHIGYIIVGPEEKSEFTVNQDFFDNLYPVVIETNTTKVYQVN